MSKKTTAPARKETTAKTARKTNWGVIIPVIVLLIGLAVMTGCFFNVNGQLTETRAALAAARQNAGTAEPAEEESTPVVAPVEDAANAEDALAAVQAELAATQAELAAANEALAAAQAELAAAYETIAEKDALLVMADEAITEAAEILSALYSTPAADGQVTEEQPAVEAEAPAEEVTEVEAPAAEAAGEVTEVEAPAEEAADEETDAEPVDGETAEVPAA